MDGEIVQSLWIGDRLSAMEQLSIRSFLDHGHAFHLYTYQDVANIPHGTVVRSGSEILPAEEIFVYRRGHGKGSPSAFSNCFRYKMLLERGGWWSDLDAICIRPLDFSDDHVLGNEREPDGSLHVAVGLFKAPAGSPLVEHCWNACQRIDKSKLGWGQIGPRLVARAMRSLTIPIRLLPPEAFYPINYWEVRQLIRKRGLPNNCYSIHLWNSKWRRQRLDPDAEYDPQCVYEKLKRTHGVVPTPRARQGSTRWWTTGPRFLKQFVMNLQRE